MLTRRIVLACLLFLASRAGLAGEIGFIEDFSLATDRTVPLKQLIPGTEDHYYYHALHYQNTEQFDKVEETLAAWIKRYQYTTRVNEIINRQALLTYKNNPQKSLALVRERLNLRFDHQRQLLDVKPNLPTSLDQNLISRATLVKYAMARYKNLQDFEPTAHDWLIATELNADRRRHLLSMLARPDYPNLAKLVVDDLNHKYSRGFGSLGIHRQLLPAQLNECLKLKPLLLNQGNFVNAYVTKLQPNPDIDWRNDPAALEAYLDRLWAFVKRLAPVHNSLKAHVLYHRLVHDRTLGIYDADRFMSYIKLPRPVTYIEPKYMQLEESRKYPCNLNADFRSVTLLPPVRDDQPLVRSILMHFFAEAANFDAFRPYIRDDYLKHLFAETKIVGGLGDPEQWYSMLPPAMYQQLKQRVDLDFAFTNKSHFAPNDPVSLDLYVKNVKSLIVKVFEINTGNFYREQLREIDTDINLDGLVANHENTHSYSEPPLRRVRRHFEFPALNKRGTYVIDFIGNGKSSRALVRKGKLRYLVRTGTAGQVFTILDEDNKTLPDATLWMAGRAYQPDKEGLITVPFSNRPQRQSVILSHSGFSSLESFQHASENYTLEAAIYVDREALLSLQTARVLVRPMLRVNGVPVTLSVLEEVKLQIASTDLDGVMSTKEIDDFQLYEDRESTYDFQVPPRLAAINFVLNAKVKNLSQNKDIKLVARQTFNINQIDRTEKVVDLHFAKLAGRYVVDVLGKSGERIPDRPVKFLFKHRDFRHPVELSLQSDAQGRIVLGPLDDIVNVKAGSPSNISHSWAPQHDAHTFYSNVQGQAGETIALPYMGASAAPKRDELSLLELRGTTFVADRFKALGIKGSMLEIKKLPRGDYDLLLKRSGQRIRIRLTEGTTQEEYVLGQYRYLQQRNRRPVQIEKIDVGEKLLTVHLGNANELTRLHVFAVRYEPAFKPFASISRVRDIEPRWRTLPSARSAYVAGRKIGDEFRYIIDRRYAKKFPGNMLNRPSLLLNPWAIRSTETSRQDARRGESFDRAGGQSRGSEGAGATASRSEVAATDFANLDFLGQGSAVLVNLKPDEKGIVTIDRELLGPHQHLNLVAVDLQSTTFRSITLPETKREIVDMRLIVGLDPEKHFIQQKQISLVGAGQKFQIEDITSSRFEMYDSMPRVYALYMTLSKDAKLAEFSFILNWHKLKPDERRTRYSDYACHELNFFLSRKDPEFFEQVVLPYLKNKKDKTFLDRWLLGEKLDEFVLPWNHGQLNIVERILLAQRLKGESPRTARHVGDLYDSIPPDIERFNRLFRTALQGRALETGDYFGLGKAAQEARGKLRDLEMKQKQLEDLAKVAPTTEAAPGNMPQPPGTPPAPDAADKKRAPTRTKAEGKEAGRKAAEEDEKGNDDLFDAAGPERAGWRAELDRRKGARQLYRKLDKTKEWVENNYYKLAIAQQNASLVGVNGFWKDYARHDAKSPFYSTNVAEASRNFTEMMFALSVLDLPLESKKPEAEFADARMTLAATSPSIIFHEEILPSKKVAKETPILVSQNFFRHGDRYRFEGNRRLDKYVTDEFLVHTVYGCQVVVTNPTSSPRKLDVLLQIPVGAMPVLNGKQTRSLQLDLQPYQTQSLEYHFYFPAPGEFAHYPAQVAQDEELLAYATPATLNVVRKLSKIDRESWDYISQYGDPGDVIKFLQANNVNRTNLNKIAWRMRDAAFFEKVTRLLARRHVYNHMLWSYSVMHSDVPAIREFLQHANQFVAACGDYLTSPLLDINPVLRKTYEQMDYRPLVNARAHQLGRRRQILNDRFFAQYHRLMRILSCKRELDDADLMAATYYMLLQDRIEEAMGLYARVNAERLETRLQYDYFTAYLNFYKSEPQLSGAIAANYTNHPVDRWRNAFEVVTTQLAEIDGGAVAVIDQQDRRQQQTKLAATAPTFDFKVESRKIALNYQNLKNVTVNYYSMDIELLFSSKPFVQEFGGRFSYIRPNLVQAIDLDPAEQTVTFGLPEKFHNSNVLVEIIGSGQTKSKAYYANSLNVQMIENYGQLQVTNAETRKPLSTVYVKVYARRKDGRVRFFKDGYTDLRGRFDYTSLNTNELDFVDRFSLLILSDQNGAIVQEARRPKR